MKMLNIKAMRFEFRWRKKHTRYEQWIWIGILQQKKCSLLTESKISTIRAQHRSKSRHMLFPNLTLEQNAEINDCIRWRAGSKWYPLARGHFIETLSRLRRIVVVLSYRQTCINCEFVLCSIVSCIFYVWRRKKKRVWEVSVPLNYSSVAL